MREKQHWRVLTLVPLLIPPLLHLLYPPGRDQAAFLLCARLAAQGHALYRDCWDVKGPLTYWAVQATMSMTGPTAVAVRAVDVFAVLATSALLVYGLPLRFGLRVGAALLWELLYLNLNYWNTAQPEAFALPFLLGGLVLLARRPTPGRAFAAGIGLALAGGFKPTALVAGAVGALVILLPGRDRRPILALVAGVGLGLTGLALALYRQGALSDYLAILAFLQGPYQATSSTHRWAALLLANRWLLRNDHLLPTLLALLALPRAWHRREGRAYLGLLLGGLLSVHLQGRYWAYHWIYLLPPLAALALWGWTYLRERLHPPAAALFLVSPFLVALLYLPRELPPTLRAALHGLPAREYLAIYGTYNAGHFSLLGDWEAARYVRERTSPRDTLLVWGFEPAIYLYANRLPATSFIYDLPLSVAVPNPWTRRWREAFMAQLRTAPPAYVLVATRDISAVEREDSATQLRRFPEFARWLETRYTLETQVERFRIYRRQR